MCWHVYHKSDSESHVLQCIAVCCSVLQCVVVHRSVLTCPPQFRQRERCRSKPTNVGYCLSKTISKRCHGPPQTQRCPPQIWCVLRQTISHICGLCWHRMSRTQRYRNTLQNNATHYITLQHTATHLGFAGVKSPEQRGINCFTLLFAKNLLVKSLVGFVPLDRTAL